jgi:hypothetical protein
MCAVDSVSGYPICGVLRAQLHVPGAMKNLIFTSIGEKPEPVFRDAINKEHRQEWTAHPLAQNGERVGIA